VTSRQPILLLVEDDPDHQILITLALEGSSLGIRTLSVASGEMALQYLLGLPPFEDLDRFPRPSLILIDLGLPGISGFDVLTAIRESRGLREIPVLVMTVLDDSHYRERALKLGAAGFFQKQGDFSLLAPVVEELLRADGKGGKG
jgi:two-component system response regulator